MANTRIVFTPFWQLRLDNIVDDRVVEHVADEVQHDAGRFAPVRTGRLAASFIVVKPRNLVRWVGSTLFYWRFAEKGTGRHEIRAGVRARSARRRPMRGALRWPGMRAGPVTRVDHPGGTGKIHLKRALFKKRTLPRF